MFTLNCVFLLTFLSVNICVSQCSVKGEYVKYKIVNGTNVRIGEFPHMVSLQRDRSHFCGGSIIHPKFILTAAHCMMYENNTNIKLERLQIVAGQVKLQYTIEIGVVAKIIRAKIHKNYINNDANDIALLEIDRYLDVTKQNIRTIALRTNKVHNGTLCTVSGWGVPKYNSSNIQNHMQMVNLTVLNYGLCAYRYSMINISVARGTICAGDDKGDACQGDSGGSLVCEGTLTGLVSSGHGCAEKYFPGLYTNVSKHVPWINKTITKFLSNPIYSIFSPLQPNVTQPIRPPVPPHPINSYARKMLINFLYVTMLSLIPVIYNN